MLMGALLDILELIFQRTGQIGEDLTVADVKLRLECLKCLFFAHEMSPFEGRPIMAPSPLVELAIDRGASQ